MPPAPPIYVGRGTNASPTRHQRRAPVAGHAHDVRSSQMHRPVRRLPDPSRRAVEGRRFDRPGEPDLVVLQPSPPGARRRLHPHAPPRPDHRAAPPRPPRPIRRVEHPLSARTGLSDIPDHLRRAAGTCSSASGVIAVTSVGEDAGDGDGVEPAVPAVRCERAGGAAAASSSSSGPSRRPAPPTPPGPAPSRRGAGRNAEADAGVGGEVAGQDRRRVDGEVDGLADTARDDDGGVRLPGRVDRGDRRVVLAVDQLDDLVGRSTAPRRTASG